MTKGLFELRAELSRLTAAPPTGAGIEWLEYQIREIEALRRTFAHSIAVEVRASVATQRTNCVMHALGIKAEEIEEWCNNSNVHPGLDFMAWLANERLIARSIGPDEAVDGDIIVYLGDDLRPLHAASAKQGLIISKWGSGATHVWRHGVFEVPSGYGSDARVYERIPPREAVSAFREWAEPLL
jgi:hypothetical protein